MELCHGARGQVCGYCVLQSLQCRYGAESFPDAARSAGSDWQTMRVVRLDNATGAATLLDDVLVGVKYSVTAWTPDDKVGPLTHHLAALMSGYMSVLA